jgi:ribosome-binding protein aMBF1 (putative translation factor)
MNEYGPKRSDIQEEYTAAKRMRLGSRSGPTEKPVPQKKPEEYTTTERMRLARQRSGKTLQETASELECNSIFLSNVERGNHPVSKKLAKQYERLFGCEPGQITGTIYERPRRSRKQQEPPTGR